MKKLVALFYSNSYHFINVVFHDTLTCSPHNNPIFFFFTPMFPGGKQRFQGVK